MKYEIFCLFINCSNYFHRPSVYHWASTAESGRRLLFYKHSSGQTWQAGCALVIYLDNENNKSMMLKTMLRLASWLS